MLYIGLSAAPDPKPSRAMTASRTLSTIKSVIAAMPKLPVVGDDKLTLVSDYTDI